MDIKAIEKLTDEEWRMFQLTRNIGGRASCQDDFAAFYMMRSAQAMAWTDEIVRCCLKDMEQAKAEGRNMIAEKYAYMMQFTSPEDYFRLAFMIPSVSDEKETLARSITEMSVRWVQQAKLRYPAIAGCGRMLHAYEDSMTDTSVETYCYGEMITHSVQTLKCIDEYYRELLAKGDNIWIITQGYLVRMLGYSSLDEAEAQASLKE